MPLNAFAPKPTVIIEPSEAPEYLAKIGIDIADIQEGLEAGEQAAGNTRSSAPVTAAGTRRWFDTTEVIRDHLSTKNGWKLDNPKGRPLSIHPAGKHILGILGGDANTGILDPDVVPKANRKKGPATGESVKANQPALFDLDGPSDETVREAVAGVPSEGHWFLLYYRDVEEIRCEISLPYPEFDGGQFQRWQYRVILPAIDKSAIDRSRIPDIGGGDVEFKIA
ncbi:hypothetical protein A7979_05860 [Rothia nasimurium]|uniref:Uncharacterized protein n=1 Tax=Rothia nasimurium TaxID=85336 RepID=A0A1Y1RNP5_9MICC|nr:hypothetical protein [Rothia nasimurium]ORC15721.1 hypothetical protein A7979_05860 [Rothia nasimurium]